jgi:DNA-directed RNA polymerase subunit E'/Rpb7
MENMKRIPLEKYASMHKMSLYQVLQKVKREELRSEVEERDGRKVTYIVIDAEVSEPGEQTAAPKPTEEIHDYKVAYEALKEEFEAYKRNCEGKMNA